MAESLPSPSLSGAREAKIDELSRHFANDDLSLEDLERRIERVYKASSIAELNSITADLKGLSHAGADLSGSPSERIARVARESRDLAGEPLSVELPQQRMLAIMSSTRRTGRWAVPRDLHVVAMASDTRLDLTQASLPAGGVVHMHVTAVMASFRIIVSPEVRVINEMHSIMADVGGAAAELPPAGPSSARTPVIRLTGTALMSEVKIKVRRREEPLAMDEDD